MAYPCFRTTLNLLLFLVLTLSVFAQTPNVNVTLGSHLIASDSSVPWKSPSGDFAFGFHKINDQKLFLLGIWFDGIPEKTLVWYANGDHLAPEGSKVELTLDGSFRLTSPQGEEIWKPRSSVDGVANAALLNNGNFILTDNSSKSLWESFKDPRDTMLPTQILEESNYSKGRFLLRLQPNDGSIVLKTIALPTDSEYGTYFTSNTSDEASPNSSGYQLVLDKSGHLNVLLDSRSVVNLTMGREFPVGDYFYRATLDVDGLFTLYVPDDICSDSKGDLGGGPCGYNSYCSLGTNRRPYCECLPGFSLSDTTNKFGGCQQNSLPNCRQGKEKPEDLYAIQEVQNTFWPTSSNYEMMPSLNEDECRRLCLSDCNCVVAVIKGGICHKKKLPLSNGRKDYTTFGKALVKVSNSAVSSDEPSRPNFTYKDLKEATDGFREQLGRGSFGTVYKGLLTSQSSRNYVAVKKLERMVQEGEKEFKTEASAIAKTHHKNLVRLLGFCDEGTNRLLVYEFMSNGTLASFLFGISKPDWNKRIQMASGIARALTYLHEECSTQIIHCDIKPQNILLDDTFTARISDFGLAKLLMNEQTRTQTGIRGTRGYVAPEWFRNMPITAKVDVYSYGVMLLEIICCRKCLDMENENEEEIILADWAYDCYKRRKLGKLVETDEEAKNDMKKLERLVMVSIWCMQEDPSLRPSMWTVTQMLEGIIQVSVPPCPSPFSSIS
ncbi:G-type lectin S-receptor serine/threonine-protein kinase [Salix suchowensis]|nr:G-type lectin S-receptor serine/threonine-protein kinase [Salix suchowensis]